MVLAGDEAVLDRPALAGERRDLVRGLVTLEDLVDGEVPHRVGGHPPAAAAELGRDLVENVLRHRAQAVVGAPLTPRLFVRLAQQAALETAVHPQLHPAEP